MTVYTPSRIKNAREAIGKQYERQIGAPAPMLPDVLAILTSPGIMYLLEELIDAVKETDASFNNESINPTN